MSNSKGGFSSLFFSIRAKFLAIILIFVAALMLTVIGFINRTVGDIVLEQGLEKGLAAARGVAVASDDPLLTNDDLALFTVIKGVTETKGIIYGMIVGKDNIVKAHSEVSKSQGRYSEPAQTTVVKEGSDYMIKSYSSAADLVYDIAVPITSARLREGIGHVHIGISRGFIDEAVQRVNRYIKYLTIAGLFIGGIGALLITTVIVKPVRELVKSAKAIGEGNLDYRINVNRRDELGELMTAFNEMSDGLKQKQFIQESFGRYVAPDVVDMILHNKETWFKGKKKRVTVLFADIRGFTSFSERKSPETVINLLNEYFSLMTEIILKNRGYVDKFIGDAIMVVFGSPVDDKDHALNAARAVCEMQEKLKGFNLARPEQERISIGIGLNTGEVVAGNLGSAQKMEYAVIGDNVNTASRLCGAAQKGQVIISKSTYDDIKTQGFEFEEMPPITVKGKSEPLEIYKLLPRRSHERKEGDDEKEALKRRQAVKDPC